MDQQQQAAPAMGAQAYAPGGRGGGSIGVVIGVLAVIAVLGVAAGVVGRLCTGRRIWGHGRGLDVEAWLERKCAACIEGRIGLPPRPPPPPPPPPLQAPENAASVEAPPPQEAKRELPGGSHS